MKLTKPESAAVLAALRLFMKVASVTYHPALTADILEIATDGGAFEPLSAPDLELLCERVNFDGEVEDTPEMLDVLQLLLREAQVMAGFWTERFAAAVETAHEVVRAKKSGDQEADDPAKPLFEFIGFNKVRAIRGATPARVRVKYPDGELSLLWMDEKMIRANLRQMGGHDEELEKALACFRAPDAALVLQSEPKAVEQAPATAAEELD